MKITIIIQARCSSTRMPNKVLVNLNGKSILERVIDQAKKIKGNPSVFVATSTNSEDDLIELISDICNVKCFRGDLEDVRSRFIEIGKAENTDIMVRFTADNPLTEPSYVNQLIQGITDHDIDYCSMNPDKIIYGTGSEVFKFNQLIHYSSTSNEKSDREHVTTCLLKNGKTKHFDPAEELTSLTDYSLTIDTPEDFIRVSNDILSFKDENVLLGVIKRLND